MKESSSKSPRFIRKKTTITAQPSKQLASRQSDGEADVSLSPREKKQMLLEKLKQEVLAEGL